MTEADRMAAILDALFPQERQSRRNILRIRFGSVMESPPKERRVSSTSGGE